MSVRSVTFTLRSSLRSAGIASTGSSFAVVVAAQASKGFVPTKFSMQSLKRGAELPPLWQPPVVNTPVSPSESPSVSRNTTGLGVGTGVGVGVCVGVGVGKADGVGVGTTSQFVGLTVGHGVTEGCAVGVGVSVGVGVGV
jgi:hypothetical protein